MSRTRPSNARRVLARRIVRVGFAVSALAVAASPALAQRWMLEATLASQVTATNNSTLGGQTPERDVILELNPTLSIRGEGARVKLAGTASLSGVAYTNNTQQSRIVPTIDLGARVEAIERLLFLDTSYRATQTGLTPFGARPEDGTTANTLTTTQARFSPILEGQAAGDIRYRVRSDNTWSDQATATDVPVSAAVSSAGGYFGNHTVLLEHDPRPVGWKFEAERSETRYRDSAQESISTDLVRVGVSYAVTTDFSAGVHGGIEKNSFLTSDPSRSIYGFDARWRPSPRTSLTAFQERRFFGSAWQLGFDHRMAHLSLSVSASRRVSTAPQALFDLPGGSNVAGVLDAILSSRYPDPVERARVVQDYIVRQGLPSSTLNALTIYSERLSLVNARNATLTWIGPRSSLGLSAFLTRTEDALDAGPLATNLSSNNNQQYGVSLTLTHRVTPTVGLTVVGDWSRIRSLAAAGNDASTQRGLRAQVNVQATPLASAFAGGRVRTLDSNVETTGRESAVFIGLNQRF